MFLIANYLASLTYLVKWVPPYLPIYLILFTYLLKDQFRFILTKILFHFHELWPHYAMGQNPIKVNYAAWQYPIIPHCAMWHISIDQCGDIVNYLKYTMKYKFTFLKWNYFKIHYVTIWQLVSGLYVNYVWIINGWKCICWWYTSSMWNVLTS